MSGDTRPPLACLPAASRPDGVFCANDILAIGFMDAARREFGLDIPGDLSVVGFDDIAMAALAVACADHRAPAGG